MMLKSVVTAIVSVTLTAALVAGCAEDRKAKEAMLQALNKQAEAVNYRFAGSTRLPAQLAGGAAPLTAGIVGMLSGGKLDWQGVASQEPLRMEATIRLTSADASAAIELPVLLRDNKLYAQLPVINKPGEYLMIDMNNMPGGPAESKPALSPDNLNQADDAYRTLLASLLADAKEDWFSRSKDKRTLPDGTDGNVYEFGITEHNAAVVSELWAGKFSAWLDQLAQRGMMTNLQADQWKQRINGLRLQPPGKIAFVVGQQGFIREQEISLGFQPVGTASESLRIEWLHSFEDINLNPEFKRPIPDKVKSVDQILQLLPKR